MKMNKPLFLALVVIGAVSACGTKELSPRLNRLLGLRTPEEQLVSTIVIPDKESEEKIVGEASYSNNLLLNHRFVSVVVGGDEEVRGIERPLQPANNLAFKIADSTIAKVNAEGIVTGKKEGKTTLTVTDKNHPDVKVTLPVNVYRNVDVEGDDERAADNILKNLRHIDDTTRLTEVLDHELYEKSIYKNGELHSYTAWDQHLAASYDNAYFSITETDGDIRTEDGAMTFKDYQWIFHTNKSYMMWMFHEVGGVKTCYPVSMVSYMDEGKERYEPMLDVLDNIFTSGRALFSQVIRFAKMGGMLDNVMKGGADEIYAAGAFSEGKGFANDAFFLDCGFSYPKSTADQEDESRYGIPYGTPTPTVYHNRYTVENGKLTGYNQHSVMTYTIGEDQYEVVTISDHFYERITDENRDEILFVPNWSDYKAVDNLFDI